MKVFQRWAIDYTGPLYFTRDQRYILVAVEYISGLVFAIGTTQKSSENVIYLLKLIILFASQPSEIITDRGLEFAADNVTEFCNEFNITHKTTSAHHPQANGRVEQVNNLLKKILKGLSNVLMYDWDQNLFKAVNIYNKTPTVFNFTPFYLAYGIEDNNETTQLQKELLDIIDQQQFETNESSEENEDRRDLAYIRLYELEKLQKDRELNTNLKARRMEVRNMLKEPYGIPATFLKGMWVFRERAKSSKLEPNYDGPFQINKSFGKGDYELIDNEGKIKGIYNQDQLRLSFTTNDNPIITFSSFNNEHYKMEKKIMNKLQNERVKINI